MTHDPDKIVAELESEFVELYKILKFEGLTESGGTAKRVIEDGLVSVNGEVETRKRKKDSRRRSNRFHRSSHRGYRQTGRLTRPGASRGLVAGACRYSGFGPGRAPGEFLISRMLG